MKSNRSGTSGLVLVIPDDLPTSISRYHGVQLLATGASGAVAALARRYGALLSAETGIDGTTIWEWGFLERVSSGLYCLDLGIDELDWPFLLTAEMLIRRSRTLSA